MVKACIFGCSAYELSEDEIAFFETARPLGFILFARNIKDPDQVKALVEQLKSVAGHDRVMILIDQEGGRVQRLKAPHWPAYPAASHYADIAHDAFEQRELVHLGARLMARDLYELGINVDCAPVLDVPQPGAHDIIGDRAYGLDRETVATMGRAVCEGLIAGGVLPIIKHIPGHGRSMADSHHELPIVNDSLEEISRVDFYPFMVNSDMPIAMTAHVVYPEIDAENCATVSKKVIKLIRKDMGFDGIILCDDLGMNALSGDMASRTKASFKAGCDVVMLCNGSLEEMNEVLSQTPKLKSDALRRVEAAWSRLAKKPEPLDLESAREKLSLALARKTSLSHAGVDPTHYERH